MASDESMDRIRLQLRQIHEQLEIQNKLKFLELAKYRMTVQLYDENLRSIGLALGGVDVGPS